MKRKIISFYLPTELIERLPVRKRERTEFVECGLLWLLHKINEDPRNYREILDLTKMRKESVSLGFPGHLH